MLKSGDTIGPYTLISKLGKGGFGEVWLGERRSKFVTTRVALKLPLEEQVDHEAVKSEAALWEQASGHPNVLPIIDADDYDGHVVIVSEYAPDGSLEDIVRQKGSLPIEKAVELAIGILGGLDFLHSKNIIHRDIKPANILLQGEIPRLADFGISRVVRTTSVSITLSGTPAYMAPEAFDRKRTRQTDIWSVGVILYQMLNGSLPFPGESLTDFLGSIVRSAPEPLLGNIPESLQQIVLKALAKQPSERYESASQMRSDLRAFQARSHQAIPPTIQAEKILPTLSAEQLGHSPLIPTMKAPGFMPADTPKHPRQTQRSDELTQSPVLGATTSILTSRTFKIVVAACLFVLIGAGGVYLLTKVQIAGITTRTNQADGRRSSATSPLNNSTAATFSSLVPYHVGDKWGFTDKNKKLVIEAKYDGAYPFSEGLALVQLNAKLVFIDENGKSVISVNYKVANPFREGLACVADSRGYGFIDKNGSTVVPLKYDLASSFSEGFALVRIGEKWGFINKAGQVAIALKYENAFSFSEGLALVYFAGKWGYIDSTGKTVITPKYDVAGSFVEGLAPADFGDKWGYIDKAGTVVIPAKYFYAESFHEGLAAVTFEKEGKIGYIDKTGNEVIAPKYDFYGTNSFEEGVTDRFEDGLALVRRDDKYGFIDKKGNEVIPLKYDDAHPFKDGLAKVRLGLNIFYVDQSGNEYLAQ